MFFISISFARLAIHVKMYVPTCVRVCVFSIKRSHRCLPLLSSLCFSSASFFFVLGRSTDGGVHPEERERSPLLFSSPLCFPVEAALHHPQRSIERPLFEHSPLFDAFFFLLKPPHGVVCCAGARGHGKEVPATRLHVVGPLQLLFTRCFIFLASFCLLRERFLWSFSSLSLSL